MNRIMIDGKSLNEIAEENGLDISTVRHRYVVGDRSYERLSRKAMKKGNHTRRTFCTLNQGERLRDIFLNTDMSFAELSRKTGVPTATIKSFMYYGNDISSVRLAKICGVLGVSMDYVMGLKEVM